MALVSKGKVRRVEIPHEPGEWMELVDIGFVTRQKAKQIRALEQTEGVRVMGPEVMVALQSMNTTDETEARKLQRQQAADPTESLDWATVLWGGIHRWSYDAPITAETIAELDDVTAEWAMRQILKIAGATTVPLESSLSSMPTSTTPPTTLHLTTG